MLSRFEPIKYSRTDYSAEHIMLWSNTYTIDPLQPDDYKLFVLLSFLCVKEKRAALFLSIFIFIFFFINNHGKRNKKSENKQSCCNRWLQTIYFINFFVSVMPGMLP